MRLLVIALMVMVGYACQPQKPTKKERKHYTMITQVTDSLIHAGYGCPNCRYAKMEDDNGDDVVCLVCYASCRDAGSGIICSNKIYQKELP